MNQFIISTDNGSDLPSRYCQANEIPILPLAVNLDGTTYTDMDVHEFYDKMRNGAMPTTSAVNLEDAMSLFRRILSEGRDLLHIAFSSGLSSTASTAFLAAEQVREEFPDRKLIVIDSLCASLGQGFLVHQAVKLRAKGLDVEEVGKRVEDMKLNVVHDFTVDDLDHLHRGGRVSKTTAVVGGLLNIKPVLHVDNEGHLVAVGKARGRKAAIQALLDRMTRQAAGFQNEEVFISHSDCREDAEKLAAMIREKFGIQHIMVDYIGPTIGSHTGIGTIALFFMGNPR